MLKLVDDKLNRKEFLNDLFNLFDKFGIYDDGGLTISINGNYGSGKSTLLNFIEEQNEINKKYHIIKYDAWKNNLFDNPLIPILYSLNNLEDKKNKLKSCAKMVVKSLPMIFANTLSNVHNVDISSLFVNENIFDDYKKYKEAISKYKQILTKFCLEKKVILLIDELDRCLPKYQIKVLETLYNIFNIPNLILVIALDKDQLVQSIKQIFGNKQNVSGYLSKFIQYEIDLPKNNDNKYLETLIEFKCNYSGAKYICANMFDLANISIRNCLQIVRELNLICNEKNKQYFYWYPIFVCLILIIKNQNRDLYKKYFYSDLQMKSIKEIKMLKQTLFNNFLNDIKDTNIETIINYLKSDNMNFAFILYFINYFYFIRYVDINSLVDYTHYDKDRIEKIIDDFEMPMWMGYEFNDTLKKIRIFK